MPLPTSFTTCVLVMTLPLGKVSSVVRSQSRWLRPLSTSRTGASGPVSTWTCVDAPVGATVALLAVEFQSSDATIRPPSNRTSNRFIPFIDSYFFGSSTHLRRSKLVLRVTTTGTSPVPIGKIEPLRNHRNRLGQASGETFFKMFSSEISFRRLTSGFQRGIFFRMKKRSAPFRYPHIVLMMCDILDLNAE